MKGLSARLRMKHAKRPGFSLRRTTIGRDAPNDAIGEEQADGDGGEQRGDKKDDGRKTSGSRVHNSGK